MAEAAVRSSHLGFTTGFGQGQRLRAEVNGDPVELSGERHLDNNNLGLRLGAQVRYWPNGVWEYTQRSFNEPK